MKYHEHLDFVCVFNETIVVVQTILWIKCLLKTEAFEMCGSIGQVYKLESSRFYEFSNPVIIFFDLVADQRQPLYVM
jgi:hypothetical protein